MVPDAVPDCCYCSLKRPLQAMQPRLVRHPALQIAESCQSHQHYLPAAASLCRRAPDLPYKESSLALLPTAVTLSRAGSQVHRLARCLPWRPHAQEETGLEVGPDVAAPALPPRLREQLAAHAPLPGSAILLWAHQRQHQEGQAPQLAAGGCAAAMA